MSRAANSTKITLIGKFISFSDKACLFRIYQISGLGTLPEPITDWFPFSQISKIFKDPQNPAPEDYIIVSEWICNTKDLLEKARDMIANSQSDVDNSYDEGEDSTPEAYDDRSID